MFVVTLCFVDYDALLIVWGLVVSLVVRTWVLLLGLVGWKLLDYFVFWAEFCVVYVRSLVLGCLILVCYEGCCDLTYLFVLGF